MTVILCSPVSPDEDVVVPGVFPDVVVNGVSVRHDATLGRHDWAGVCVAAVVEAHHVVAEIPENAVVVDAVLAGAGPGVAVHVQDHRGAGGQLGLVPGSLRRDKVIT